MAKTKQVQKKKNTGNASFDGVFLFKLVFYLLVGSAWLKMSNGDSVAISLPIGLMIGLIFTTHEHFQIDRKVEYGVMIVAMLFGYFAPYGLYINL